MRILLTAALALPLFGALTPEQWREDLAYLVKTLPASHKNLFFSLT
jgi:hypothetical protein